MNRVAHDGAMHMRLESLKMHVRSFLRLFASLKAIFAPIKGYLEACTHYCFWIHCLKCWYTITRQGYPKKDIGHTLCVGWIQCSAEVAEEALTLNPFETCPEP